MFYYSRKCTFISIISEQFGSKRYIFKKCFFIHHQLRTWILITPRVLNKSKLCISFISKKNILDYFQLWITQFAYLKHLITCYGIRYNREEFSSKMSQENEVVILETNGVVVSLWSP